MRRGRVALVSVVVLMLAVPPWRAPLHRLSGGYTVGGRIEFFPVFLPHNAATIAFDVLVIELALVFAVGVWAPRMLRGSQPDTKSPPPAP